MAGPERLVSVRVPKGAIELRIHGVSGTPPDEILRDNAIRVMGDERSGFYRSSASVDAASGLVEAYSWGGLTSLSRFDALATLLLPFSLLNVAGFMAPTSRQVSRFFLFLTRALALLADGLVVLLLFLAAFTFLRALPIDGWQDWLPPFMGRGDHIVITAALLIALSGPIALSAIALSMRKSKEEQGVRLAVLPTATEGASPNVNAEVASTLNQLSEATVNPYSADSSNDPWNSPGLARLLSKVHWGWSASVVGALAGFLSREQSPSDVGSWFMWAGVLGLAVGVVWVIAVLFLPNGTASAMRWARVTSWLGLATAIGGIGSVLVARPNTGVVSRSMAWFFLVLVAAILLGLISLAVLRS
jgi:hypothetical protein